MLPKQGLPQPASTPMSGCSRHAAQQRRAVSKWRFGDACGSDCRAICCASQWLFFSATETEPSAVYLALIFNPDEPNAFFCLQSVETPATDLIIRMNFIDGAHSNNATDAGLLTLVTMLRFLGIGADPEQIRHRFGGTPIGIPQMLRVAP